MTVGYPWTTVVVIESIERTTSLAGRFYIGPRTRLRHPRRNCRSRNTQEYVSSYDTIYAAVNNILGSRIRQDFQCTNFRGDYISRIFAKLTFFAKYNRENFQILWIQEILGFLPKSPRKMKEIR